MSEASKIVRQLVDELREQPLIPQPEDELACALTVTITSMHDVVQTPTCAHGRRVGELCPHCMATVCIRP